MRRQFAISVFVFGVFFVEALPCAGAVLVVSPDSFDFTIRQGGQNPSSQVLRISNAEAGSLAWTIEEDSAWLSLNRYSGVVETGFTSLVVVTVDAVGLGAGVYTCDMVVRSDGAVGSPRVIRVNLDVVGPTLPTLEVSPLQLDYTVPEGGENPSNQVLSISNAEAGSLSWTIAEDCAWLSLNRYSGIAESGFTSLVMVTVDAAGLGAGVYTCDMIVRSDGAAGSPQVVTVNFDVVGPRLAVSETNLHFVGGVGNPNPGEQVFTIANVGGAILEWIIEPSEPCQWLAVEPVAGLLGIGEQDEVVVSVDTSGLDTGTYNCALMVSSAEADNSPVLIPVTLSINPPRYSGGSGTAGDPYHIHTVAELIAMGETPQDHDKHFVLTADIDLAAYTFDRAVIGDPNFAGVFDGKGHTIRNLTIVGDARHRTCLGLFAGIMSGGEVRDLAIEDAEVSCLAYGAYSVGALCGDNDGAIEGCSAAGTVKVGTRGVHVGGLCGRNSGVIIDCEVAMVVRDTGTSYVYSESHSVGGLCGSNSGVVIRCRATGEVSSGGRVRGMGGLCGSSSGTISRCYAGSEVAGGYSCAGLGGLCGKNWGLITFCRATGSVYGGYESYGVGGLCGTTYGVISECYATGATIGGSGIRQFGGLCGIVYHTSIISRCYAKGSVRGGDKSISLGGFCGYNSGSIAESYATGAVEAGSSSNDLGGFCGKDLDGTISGCLWDKEASGLSISAGGTGKMTDEMQAIDTFLPAGWDFVGAADGMAGDAWRMCVDGVAYPRLSWEYSGGGDFDCADGVGMEDLVYLCGRWLMEGDLAGAADSNGDGVVGMADLGVLVEEWVGR